MKTIRNVKTSIRVVLAAALLALVAGCVHGPPRHAHGHHAHHSVGVHYRSHPHYYRSGYRVLHPHRHRHRHGHTIHYRYYHHRY